MNQQITVQSKVARLPIPEQIVLVEQGKSIEQLVIELYGTTDGVRAWVRGKRVAWVEVPRERWQYVRPRVSDVTKFTYLPRGGGGGGRNSIFATIAVVALTIFAPAIGAAAQTALVGAGVAASTAAFIGSVVSASIVVGGSLLVNRVFAPDTNQALDAGSSGSKRDNVKAYSEVSTDTNPFGKEAYLPIVVGSRRISPPDVTQPYVYILDGVQYIDRLFGLWGKHSISDVRMNNTSVDDFPSVTTQILDGDGDTTTYSMIDKITRTRIVNETLPSFRVTSGTKLEDQSKPENSEPRWIYFSTSSHPSIEEISIRVRLSGMYKTDDQTADVILPVRFEFRPEGSGTWTSLPEAHFHGRTVNQVDQEVRVRWDDKFAGETGGAIKHRFYADVGSATFALSDGSSGAQWAANNYFDGGGGVILNVVNMRSRRSGINITLDPNIWPKGRYEWRMMRGYALPASVFTNSNYQIAGDTPSLFLGRKLSGDWAIDVDQSSIPAQIAITSVVSIADEHPVQLPGIAQLAMRVKGQNAQAITCHAARYVMDWNGSAWATETASCKNPATHYRQILYDFLTHYNISTSLIDNDAFVAWRQECIDRGYECNAIFAGDSIGEILAAIATAGFARRVFSDRFSIEYFRDRSAETPMQLFSYRNSEITFSIAGADRQAGLRVAFDDEDNDFVGNEVEVQLDNAADNGSYESFSYRAITKSSLVRRRAYFDLLQIDLQRRVWTVETATEGVVCQPGDLVSVVTDLFDDNSHGFRVMQVLNPTTFVIDQTLSAAASSDFVDDPSIDNLFDVGERSILFMHTPTGIEQRTISDISDNVVVVDSAFTTTPVSGTIGTITTLSNSTHRCIVLRIEMLDEERARLTLVDEAPRIYEELTRKFG